MTNGSTLKPDSIKGSVLGETNKKIRDLLILSITKDGQEIEKDIRQLPRKDGIVITQAIEELTTDITPDQKKGI